MNYVRMEPAATGHSEKTFSYVVRAPSSEGFDVMNVDVKIDTSWVFQDAEDSSEEQGHLPEGVARGSPDVDTGTLRRQLESSEQKLLAAVDKYVMSESGLRSRIQELEQSERKLLRKVDQLSARVGQERSASLRAQEQLEVLRGELASQVLEKERAARRQRWRLQRLREQLRRKDEALGQQAVALERCRRAQRREMGLVREQERALRAQVQRLERDVRRLCRAAGLLLAELDAPGPGPAPAPAPGPAPGAPHEAAGARALQARAGRERDAGARRLRERRATERTLRGQLEELRCCVYELKLSEIGLQSQVEDLSEQNRSLREELGAQARGERGRRAAPAGPCSLDALGCVQDEWLLLPQEELLAACGNPGWQTPVHSHGAPGPRASAGQPTEGPCPRGSVGAGRGPSVLVPGLETTAGLLGDLAGPHHGQPGPAEPSLHEQILLVICGCPSGQCAAGSLLPAELAWVSAQRPPAAPAPEPFLLVQTSTFPPWDPAGDTAVLLLQETSPEDLQTQQVPDARPLPAPRARGQPCWDHHRTRGRDAPLCQESPQTLPHRFPGTGPRDLDDPWKEGGGALALSPEVWGMRRTWDRKEEDLGDGCQRGQESQEDPSLEGSAGALEGLQDPHGALGSPAAASCPRPRRARPLPLLQGAASVSTEDPESLSRTRPAEEHVGGLLGGLSWEEEGAPSAAFFRAHGAKGPSPPGAQLLPEQDGATGRVQGQEDNHAWSEHARLPLEGGPGDGGPGEEEKASHPEGSSLGSRGWEARETLSLAEEGGLPLSPRFALSPEGAEPARPPRAPRKGRVRSALTIDAFAEEMEACFRLLSTLKLGSGGRGQGAPAEGGDRSFAGRRHSGQGHAGPRQGLDTCPAKEADPEESCEDVSPGETEALGTGQVISGLGPDLGDLCLGPRGASEWGQDLHQPPRALERARRRFRQLVSGLKEERSRVLHENAQLQRDQERCHRKMRALQTERQRTANRISALEQDNGALLGDISRLRRELDQYLQVIADLEDCNGKSYSKISELEEDNERLRGCLGQLQRAMSQSTRKCRGLVQDAAQENRELKALISELGLSYKELIKDVVLGIEEMIGALRGQNAHLLRRIQVLEREVAVRMSTDAGRLRGAEEHPQGKGKEDKVGTVERAVQVTPLSDQLTVGVHGPPLEKETGLARGWMGPSSGAENPRCQAETAAPSLVGRSADVSGALQGDIDGTGVREARLGKGEERPQLSEDRGPAPRSPSSGPQLWDPEAESSEEDLQLHVRRLRHQVLTLQCQLRDQGSAGRALQEARDEALCLRDRLEGQVDELQRKQREANLAVTPLKAKLASLVQKCRDRNRLLTRLLRELCRHGAADHLLSEAVHSMVNDVALAEYAAAFLAPGVPETSHHADTEPEKTAAVRAQKCLLNPEMDSVLPRPWHSESWPVTEAEWPAQTARLDALELPLPSGPAPDPGPCGAASGLPAERLEGRGGTPCPALLADSPPPPPGLLSPARILAFHRELGRSVRDSRASQSPLEL